MYTDPIFLIKAVGMIGVAAIVFAESGLFFGFFFPGDSLLFSAGLLASQNYFNPILLIVVCFFAAALGDSVGYWFGKKTGPKIFNKEDSILFHKSHIQKAQLFYQKYGRKTIILARFIPIVRTFAPIVAGVGDMEYKSFLSFNLIGAALWTFLMIGLGYGLGASVPNVDHYILPIILVIIVISFLPALKSFFPSIFSFSAFHRPKK